MTGYLVTGATGQLGRPTAAALRADGHDVRGLTSSGREGTAAADLVTGEGVDTALEGIDTVVHLATANGRRDLEMARTLARAARRSGVGHLVLVSIVGVDRIPLPFYRDRLRIEEIVAGSGVPSTVQRATQFHSLVAGLFAAQRFVPAVVAPAWRFQPVAAEEVAVRLAELAVGEPRGRVPDIGGPEQRDLRDLHAAWKRASGDRRPLLPVRLPGKLFAAYEGGAALVRGEPFGRRVFEDYLRERYGA